MQSIPVVDINQRPLMPTTASRAKRWIQSGKATPFWKRGVFCVRLNVEPSSRFTQPIAVGIDPGSKREAFTVKSATKTYLNVQTHAVDWVKDAVEAKRNARRSRRYRNTPYRAICKNRQRGGIPPSTKARWQWKLRICNWLTKLFPVSAFVVEDIKAKTFKNGRKWNVMFSPLEVGKRWFYGELARITPVHIKQGTEGHDKPDNTRLIVIVPLRFHRRQLHRFQPSQGGIRSPYGGTMSEGFKRGGIAKHPKYGVVYIGGASKGKVSLHSIATGKRLTQGAKPVDIKFLSYSSWRLAGVGG
ncbi:MAG TPA: RRXRR domain-containing protein [Oscillatoriales cyanobacterium M59_W2019_021]|nr:RRXRR domain-containing protein [Oscillatoriales cyanobacterium M4454_W2019_049]HIK50458.1 RRXRR domain-containing protein [Oscillatoriales cyanobacterium M59_W2019_021]